MEKCNSNRAAPQDLDALCLRWRIAASQGALGDAAPPHRLEFGKADGAGSAGGTSVGDVVVRRVAMADRTTFLTHLRSALPLPPFLLWRPRLEAHLLLVCSPPPRQPRPAASPPRARARTHGFGG